MTDPIYNFSGRDYPARFEALLDLLLSDVPELTDRNHSDAGISQIRLTAREGDQLGYFEDFIFDAGTVKYAQFKQDLIDLGLLVGYLPTLAAAASTRLELTRVAGVTGIISIPKYSAFGRSDNLRYLTVDDNEIAADGESIQIDAIQGTAVTRPIEPSAITIPDFSGHPRVGLGTSVASGSVEVSHGTDPVVAWSEVDSFWRSAATDNHFLLELNGDDDSVWLVFGDGVNGSLPPDSANIQVSFVQTDEANGNCGSGVIYSVPDELTNLVTCANIEPATGGAAAEDADSIRRMIPAMTRTQRRGLTLEDYEALVGYMAGVLHVEAVDRGMSEQWPHLHVGLFITPNGGGPASSLLKTQIAAQCAEWGHLGAWPKRYIIQDAVPVPIDVTMRIGVMAGYNADTVRAAAIAAAQAQLSADNQEIGGVLSFRDLNVVVNAVSGLSWVEFDSPIGDVVRGSGEINVPGTITATAQ